MVKSDFQRVASRIEGSDQAIVDWQRCLTAIKAIAPESGGVGEKEKADYLRTILESFNPGEIFSIDAPDERVPAGYRPNLVAKFYGRMKDRTLWIISHLDVVPPGDLNLWKSDPFTIKVEGDKIYGRGVEDNQQSIVTVLALLKALIEEKVEPGYTIGFIAVSDEETGSAKGLKYVVEKRRGLFGENDLILVPDGGNEDGTMIEVAEKSMLWLKFRTIGKQSHGSRPDLGVNSFKAASYLVTELDKLHQLFNASDHLYNYPISTFEPTMKEANVPNINTIPGEDCFYLDSRILPRYKIDDVLRAVDEKVRSIEERFNVRVEISQIQSVEAPPPTPVEAPVVKALEKAIKEVTGKGAKIMGIGGGTVAAILRRAGLPAVVWSTVDETAHQPNEYCKISNVKRDAKTIAWILLEM